MKKDVGSICLLAVSIFVINIIDIKPKNGANLAPKRLKY